MVVRFVTFVLILNVQIFQITARGITLPLNTVTTKIESFTAQPENVQSTDLEDTSAKNDLASYEPNPFLSNLLVPTSSMKIPNFQNSFNMVLAYAKECALKYGRYNQMSLRNHESSRNLPQSCIKPMLSEPNVSFKPSTKLLSPELSSPLNAPQSCIKPILSEPNVSFEPPTKLLTPELSSLLNAPQSCIKPMLSEPNVSFKPSTKLLSPELSSPLNAPQSCIKPILSEPNVSFEPPTKLLSTELSSPLNAPQSCIKPILSEPNISFEPSTKFLSTELSSPLNAPQSCIKPILSEPNVSFEPSTKLLSPELSLPVNAVSISSVSFDSLSCNINNAFINNISTPCCGSLDTPKITSNIGLSLPLSIPCTIEPSQTLPTSVELAKSIEPKSQLYSSKTEQLQAPLPVCSLRFNESPNNINNDVLLNKPRSTFTLPLSVTSSFTCVKPIVALPSSASLDNNLTSSVSLSSQSPLLVYNKAFVTPQNLPNPLMSVPDQEVRSLLEPSSFQNPFIANSVVATNPYLSSLTVTDIGNNVASINKCPALPISTKSYQNTSVTNISSTNLDENLASSSTCINNILQPPCYLAALPSLSTLPSTNVVPQRISGSSCPQSEYISLCALPNISQYPLNRYSLFESLKTSLDNSYESTMTSLSLTPSLPTSLSLSSSLDSNCLSTSPSIPYSVSSNPFLYSSDILSSPTIQCNSKSFKRSFETTEKGTELKNVDKLCQSIDINANTKESTPNTVSDKLVSNESSKKLLELISLAEMLNDHDMCTWDLLNEIVSMLKTELNHIQYSA